MLFSAALLVASVLGKTEVMEVLLQNEAYDINYTNIWESTAISWCANKAHTIIVKLILQKDSSTLDDQVIDSYETALMTACYRGHAAIIELLIRSGANLDLKDIHNKTAFQILDEEGGTLSKEEKTRLKDLPRLIKQEQLQTKKSNNQWITRR